MNKSKEIRIDHMRDAIEVATLSLFQMANNKTYQPF